MAHARLSGSRLATLWLGACAVSFASACGGSAPAPESAATAAPQIAPAAPAPDLTEVPEPAGVVALARWASPDASVGAVQGWTGIPLDLRELLQREAPAWLLEVAATDAPVDAVITLAPGGPTDEPNFDGAVALGLRGDVEEVRKAALARGEQLEPMQPGVYRLESSGKRPACMIAASAGPAPTRLVCGEDSGDLEQLGPYLTRTLPRKELGQGDFVAEIRLVPFEQRYGATLQQGLRMGASVLPAQFQIGQPRFDRALTDAVYGVADETLSLTSDLDKLFLSIDARPEVARGSLAVQFRGAKSWTVQTAQDSGRRAAAAPPMFWRLPADSTSASFARGANPERYAGIRKTLATLLDGWLTHEGMKASDRDALVSLFSDEYATDAPSVAASGPLDPAVAASILAKDGDTPAGAMRRELVRSGWQVFGMEEPADKWLALSKRLVAAYNTASMQKQVARALQALDKSFPVPQLKLARAPKELPQGTVEMTLTFASDAKTKGAKSSPVTMHAFVMPDGGRTWMGFGIDRGTVVARLQAVRNDAPENGTIAGRRGLEILRQGGYTSAGFITLEALARSMESALTEVLPKYGMKQLDVSRLLNGIPHAGKTPILIASSVRNEGETTAWTTGFDMPGEAIQDAVAMVMQMALGQLTAEAGKASR